MTKKDFELIASILKAARDNAKDSNKAIVDNISESFADKLWKQNPRFDRSKFLDACDTDGFC